MAFHGKTSASPTSPSLPESTQEFGRASPPVSMPSMSIANSEATNESPKLIFEPSNNSYMDGIHVNHIKKCEEIRQILDELDDPSECLIMVDALQRLCIDYHFEEEINTILDKHYGSLITFDNLGLHDIALHFRLLRQVGYFVTTDVFDNFKDKKGHFKQELSGDIRGLMSLYEASQLGIEGEDTLDQANEFAHKHLSAKMMNLEPELAKVVGDTLEHPYHKNLARFKARYYLSPHQTYKWVSVVKELAMMDFSMVQCLYLEELQHIYKWWREMGLSQELKFARNQPLKWYFWSLTALPEPKYSQQRIELTKPISLVYVIDDIFDVHGTLDELIHFTRAVNKWETTTVEELPEYMKICFKALDNITNEISEKVLKEHGWNPINILQKAWASLCDAFLIEAKWFASKWVPKSKEYLENGVISSGVPLVLTHLFFLLGQSLTKENIYCLEHNPALISCTATILRLWDDLGSAKDEDQEGHDGSYIECYIKEHGAYSIKSPQDHIFCKISDSWKQLNRECLSKDLFSPIFKRASLNVARMVPLMYSYEDNQNLLTLKEYINSVLYENVPF
ncbi:hypothetical protein NE237_028677 [Protea cynaroides]|uniref:Uncharacterized protein n=1 Tax=Protea cynaroides TaxID=273540 RepID=A0A9Q0JVD2_9MAGN|nr:hypothetical protein NE237_028677 [Protea cynaroides]